MESARYVFGNTTVIVQSGMDGITVPEVKTSMRLIDADRLSEAIHENVSAIYEDAVCAKEDCLTEVYAAPTVDAVPVVRKQAVGHEGYYAVD